MPGCTIRSSNVVPDHKGECMVSPLEYETLGMVGANCDIGDLDAIARINRAMNEMGIDTIDGGGALAIAMEAGVIPWGDAERCVQVVEGIADGEPLSLLIGSGGVTTAKVLGVERIPAVKGQIMSAYDPRSVKGLGVTYATSPQGADHTCGSTARGKMDHHSAAGQVEASRGVQVNVTIYDYIGLCMFAAPGVGQERQVLCDLLYGRFGWQMMPEDLLELSRQTIRDEKEFNRRAGFTEADDRIPDFFREEVNPATGTTWDIPDADLQLVYNF
jgi:aldehyde:ferredoxin oxidoreductase